MSRPLLSAAMIVRDEESNLPACLESIRGMVDEIVIVDTGSSDDTIQIAESFGARVHEQPWRGRFSEPRNKALELAQGEWILYIDADERLRLIDPEVFRSRLRSATEVALRVQLRLRADLTPGWEYRLWRSDPRVRFEGTMHEKVAISIGRVADQDRRMIGESELFLEHVGYDGEQRHKHVRNLPLLRAELEKRPDNPYAWHHLATTLEALGRAQEAALALDRGVDVARATTGGSGFLPYLKRICDRTEQGIDATELLDEALGRYPYNLALNWLKLTAEIREGRYGRALRRLELFDVDVELPVEDVVAYPVELLGARAAEARGLCLFKVGRYAESAAAYGEAEHLEPDQSGHRAKRLLAEHLARTTPPRSTAAPNSAGRFLWSARELLKGLTIDLGGIPIGLAATDAMRAVAMRSLLGRVAQSDEEPVAQLRFGSHPTPSPRRPADGATDLLELWYDDETLDLAFGSLIAGHVEAAEATLGGYAEDLEAVFRRTAPFMLASLLAPHERFLLHAGALHRDGRTVLVLGSSGAGKSTLAFGALGDGWSVLSDDLVLARIGVGGPEVAGVPKPLVVPSELLEERTLVRDSLKDHRGRSELAVHESDTSWRSVSEIAVVGHGTDSATELADIERHELLRALLLAMLAPQRAVVRRYTWLAIALCQKRAYHVLHSRVAKRRGDGAAAALARAAALSAASSQPIPSD